MLIPVILCGGAGSRLWPVSREMHPKPFIRLENGQSLLQNAWLRGASFADVTDILTVTNHELYFKVESEYREVAGKAHKDLVNSFILEPFGRNTAPAVAAAAMQIAAAHGEDALMLVLAADHLIADQAAFAQAVSTAMQLARQGKLVTFGITPEAPETGFGYIEASGNTVLRFVEKPTFEKAQEYVASGSYLWNSGMFCFSAGTLLKEMALHCPEIVETTRVCLQQASRAESKGAAKIELSADDFSQVPDDSIDYAVMEKSKNVAVVQCSIGWSDIGSWRALGDLISPDDEGNRIEGNVMIHDVSNTHIQSHERMTGVVGVDNLIIVDTPDALLVVDRSRAQDVKHLYAQLKSQGHDTHKVHRTVHRPWGTYTVLEEGPRFKIKRIVVKPAGRLSLQMHHHRSEHWIVVSGMARVVNGDNELFVNSNESTYIPAGNKHRLENPGVVDLVMIEVQSGDYLGEDDIVRFDDVYGRK
ncbi:mannose-1-phosphate guanylyltransferase/mannose-6-phosphate isomerase [Collimonas sp. OK412]|uniref:mannose-1-phosphate guanylyltransferase/mannose-6-phosphate isomerase n=1 Tax=Collimonas sp. (strain OK412) TaxID=1801619 RepID=UPI0008F42651|nr:mannose-1-phosphate guanylyltransferase/mannose-6-phosphate isomerase [Collimonas sp. OK412]SFC48663.1 mannose-1-phosphate guanylyltransferase [Collimonas sp. OK412]